MITCLQSLRSPDHIGIHGQITVLLRFSICYCVSKICIIPERFPLFRGPRAADLHIVNRSGERAGQFLIGIGSYNSLKCLISINRIFKEHPAFPYSFPVYVHGNRQAVIHQRNKMLTAIRHRDVIRIIGFLVCWP